MKLNLLPTYVSKGKQAVAAWVFAALIVLVSIGATIAMKTSAQQQYEAVKARADALDPIAKNTYEVSRMADDVINNAKGVILNSMLAQSMLKHNSAYPDFYDKVMPYIPSFFRVTRMTATPLGAEDASLTLDGVVQSPEQYRDLMLALNRIPNVKSVARTGFAMTQQYVPNLVEIDQTGRRINRGEQHIPDDPIERLNYFIAQGMQSKVPYTGESGFGAGLPGLKGPMPSWSSITVTIVLPGRLETPNPKATLTAGAAGAPAGGGPVAGGMPGPAGMPGAAMPGGPAAAGPGGATGRPAAPADSGKEDK